MMLTQRLAEDLDPTAHELPTRDEAHPAVVSEPPVERPIAMIVDTIAAELAELAACGEGLQGLASCVMVAGTTNGFVTELQVVDLLVQRLNALSAFARSIAPSLPGDWRVDVGAATRALPLAETRNRLEGRAAARGDDAGDCDFF